MALALRKQRKPRVSPDREKIEKIRAKCKESLFWTAWYLCGFTGLSIVLHYGLCLWLEKGRAEGRTWFLCLVPRGHFKTSLLHIAFVVHELIKNPELRILVVMHNSDMAKAKGRKLRAIFKSRATRTYFPELIPAGELGTQTEITINREGAYAEPSVNLVGISSGIVGGHYDIIIIDDGIEFKHSQQASTMELAVEFLRALNPLFETEDSMLLVLGTLWPGGQNGYYETLLANPDFYSLVLGCYCDERWDEFLAEIAPNASLDDEQYIATRLKEENRELAWQPGQPIFPERRTMKGLAKDLATMGSFLFSHQMLNVLMDEGTRRFRREDFRVFTLSYSRRGKPSAVYIDNLVIPWEQGIVTAAMDPTGGMSKDSDYAGITACWWHPPQKLACLLDFWHEQGVDPMGQIEQLYKMAVKWDVDLLICEGDAMQTWVEAWLKQEMKRRGRWFRTESFRSGGVRKGKRILDRFHPYVASHQFHVLYPDHEPVIEHLVTLNIARDGTVLGDSPALADTFPMHVEWWPAGDEDRTLDPNVVRDETEDAVNIHEFKPRYRLAPSAKLRSYR